MGWVESLQKAIDYMEEHLTNSSLSIENIAKQANVSEFHFQRIFSILTDISTGEYIRRRRLTLAAQELLNTNSKVIDIALKYGYETPEAFTKAFRRQHGMTPSQVRTNSGMLRSYNRLMIQVSLKGAEPMNYKIIEKESFQAVGVMKEFSCVNGENLRGIPKMWDDVNTDGTDNRLIELNNGELKALLGICVDKRCQHPGLIDYWIAADSAGDVPDGLSALEIPASKWAVFEVHGAMPDAIQKVWKQIFTEWFPSNPYEHAGTPEMELYFSGDAGSPDYYSEIWIPIK
ncbi:AraC family transcriptional regulator [Neobacillus mesonae]|uniref:AraC family transcriptional regulator n=1 Tax=Neobacillus mesonae TaxID=1193713 RepID=UPI00257407CC|nr:AraC family transcriptional regulator [Neobacillus mesonae]